MMLELPPGVSLNVPDLSRFGPQEQKPLLAVTIKPGDKVMVLLPRNASQMEVAQIADALKQWAPEVEFLTLSGPESITVIPAPAEDKAPQGLDAVDFAAHKAAVEEAYERGLEDGGA